MVELSFLNDNFTFIPKDEFSADTAALYLQSHNPIDPFSSIRFNPIHSKNCVVCFTYNEEIEFFFENKYPFVNIIHNSNRILNKTPNELKYSIQLIFHENYFEIVAVGERFEYYNCKTYESENDVAYALMHFLDSKEKNYKVSLFGNSKIDDLAEKLRQLLPFAVKDLDNTEYYSLISV